MADNFSFKIDLSEFEKEIEGIKKRTKKGDDLIAKIASQAYSKAIEIANTKLKSTRNMFLQHLKMDKGIGSGGETEYIIVLAWPAMWREEGVSAHNMKQTHLKGKKSMVIPFKHGGQNSMLPAKQQVLNSEIKSFLKKEKVSASKPILDSNQKPILSSPGNVKAAKSFGAVPSSIKGKNSGQSVLNNLQIYQHAMPKKGGGEKIQKTAMTFRTLSQNSEGWDVPALEGAKILDEVYDWILDNYAKIIEEELPNIVMGA